MRPHAGFRTAGLLVALLCTQPVVALAQATDTLRVPVGDHRLFMLVSGTGGPSVVLEAGDRSTHRAWNPLRQQLTGFTRVVAYDRAGR